MQYEVNLKFYFQNELHNFNFKNFTSVAFFVINPRILKYFLNAKDLKTVDAMGN